MKHTVYDKNLWDSGKYFQQTLRFTSQKSNEDFISILWDIFSILIRNVLGISLKKINFLM